MILVVLRLVTRIGIQIWRTGSVVSKINKQARMCCTNEEKRKEKQGGWCTVAMVTISSWRKELGVIAIGGVGGRLLVTIKKKCRTGLWLAAPFR